MTELIHPVNSANRRISFTFLAVFALALAQTPAPRAPRKPKRCTLHADPHPRASATSQLLGPPAAQRREPSQLLPFPIVRPSKTS